MDLHDVGWEPIVGQVVGNLNKAGFVAGRIAALDEVRRLLIDYRRADINLISCKLFDLCAAARVDLDLVTGVTAESIDRANNWLQMHRKNGIPDVAPAADDGKDGDCDDDSDDENEI